MSRISRNLTPAILVIFTAVFATLAQSSDPSSTKSDISNENDSAPQAVTTTRSWTGVYGGGYIGGNFSMASADTSTIFASSGYFASSSVPAINNTGTQRLSPNGVNAGATLGYNYQTGKFVIGAETDFGGMTGSETTSRTTTYPCCSPSSFTVTQSVKTSWIYTARPRAGVAFGNTLLYGTGGLAVTNLDYNASFSDNFANASESGRIKETRAGWTAGGGVEYKFADRWSVKGEYLFVDFRRATITSNNLTTAPPTTSWPQNTFTHSIYLKDHLVRFGINYRF
ncbi:MAG TPA: outer membrane protein [Pyrinomonadaceae bacterium]|nr:outer membrane protein [Pyrinomonadaceae bacterium]